ncbi:hypothetical protein AVEN_103937-1 [Araneus ventricosus]|uniref:Uncharacterized protein n=1 Tax=Araneus ventricosus TaxID=182803 RepID=A0A4Y2UWZ3_ARAVE|nr:hypothetical protein AVEN_103937-1 [Araneus ventricosus]
MEAPGEVIKKIERTPKLALKWTMHNIREFFHLKRCTKCQGFGYLVKDYKDVRPTCESCAGRHETWRCRSPQIVTAVNCSHYNYCYRKEHSKLFTKPQTTPVPATTLK